MNSRVSLFLTAALLVSCGGGDGAEPASSQKTAPGPTIFLGDSITESWDIVPPASARLRALVPGEINAGVTGQLSIMMLDRLQTAVLDKHPSRVVILAGTNDVSDFILGGPAIEYGALIDMILKIQAAGAQVILCTIPPLGDAKFDYGAAGVHDVEQWNVTVRGIAKAYGLTLVDYWSAMTQPDGEQITADFGPDEIHPNAAGYAAMWTALKSVL